GSDAPVETADPFKGLHAAVTRRRADGQPGPQGWYPEQRVSFDQALKAYTQPLPGNDEVDLLQAGMPADMIVLEQDPSRLDPHELADLKPLITVVAGEIVYSR
ncbi:MAG: amidohydrolase family protein, partial [Chloroflexi bacterium]|nr:amidohydrolase family protein [Chloroflexota bacterium]